MRFLSVENFSGSRKNLSRITSTHKFSQSQRNFPHQPREIPPLQITQPREIHNSEISFSVTIGILQFHPEKFSTIRENYLGIVFWNFKFIQWNFSVADKITVRFVFGWVWWLFCTNTKHYRIHDHIGIPLERYKLNFLVNFW